MKDKIIEIWDKIGNVITTQTPNMTIYYDHFDAASEIADMNKKFVEWCMKGTFIPDPDDDSKYWDFLPKLGEVSWTFDELFLYWYNKFYNIKSTDK